MGLVLTRQGPGVPICWIMPPRQDLWRLFSRKLFIKLKNLIFWANWVQKELITRDCFTGYLTSFQLFVPTLIPARRYHKEEYWRIIWDTGVREPLWHASTQAQDVPSGDQTRKSVTTRPSANTRKKVKTFNWLFILGTIIELLLGKYTTFQQSFQSADDKIYFCFPLLGS